MNEKWVAAGISLAKNPTSKILCPVDKNHGYLTVSDHYIAGSAVFERIITCSKCGARNVLRMTYSKT